MKRYVEFYPAGAIFALCSDFYHHDSSSEDLPEELVMIILVLLLEIVNFYYDLF